MHRCFELCVKQSSLGKSSCSSQAICNCIWHMYRQICITGSMYVLGCQFTNFCPGGITIKTRHYGGKRTITHFCILMIMKELTNLNRWTSRLMHRSKRAKIKKKERETQVAATSSPPSLSLSPPGSQQMPHKLNLTPSTFLPLLFNDEELSSLRATEESLSAKWPWVRWWWRWWSSCRLCLSLSAHFPFCVIGVADGWGLSTLSLSRVIHN